MVLWSVVFFGCSFVGWAVVWMYALHAHTRVDARCAEIAAAVRSHRADAHDVVVVVRPAWRLFVRTELGLGAHAVTEDAEVSTELLAERLANGLRPVSVEALDPWPPAPPATGPDGPLSSRRPLLHRALLEGDHGQHRGFD